MKEKFSKIDFVILYQEKVLLVRTLVTIRFMFPFFSFVVWKGRLFHNFHNLDECQSEEVPLLKSRYIRVTGGRLFHNPD
jgi:hypothetical protein